MIKLLSLQLLFFLTTITKQTIGVNAMAANCNSRECLYTPHLYSLYNNHNHNNRHYHSVDWQSVVNDAGLNKVSNYHVSDNGDDDVVKHHDNINKLLTPNDNGNFETSLSGIKSGSYGNGYVSSAKNRRAPSVYPEIMTDLGKVTAKPEQLSVKPERDRVSLNYNSLLNQLSQLQTSGQLAALSNANSGTHTSTNTAAGNGNGGMPNDKTKGNKLTLRTDGIKETANTPSDTANSGTFDNTCNDYMDPTNATAVLERVLQELELIKSAKMGNMTPEGAPCSITNVWNSEIIGLRFNISLSSSPSSEQSDEKMGQLNVALLEHKPPKANAQMDTNWTCSGYTLHSHGGPFYLTAIKKHTELMATFTGICKTCGGVETIFGVWNFVHTPKDCRDLQMFVETKRDIFRKDILHMKQNKEISNVTTTTTSTTTEKPSSNHHHTDTTKFNKETKDLLDELASYFIQ